jgi:CP family cyanate transporter-like MFS transporter
MASRVRARVAGRSCASIEQPMLRLEPAIPKNNQMARDGIVGIVALLWLAGAALRVSVLAVPPVIAFLRADLSMSATEIGILSGLPMIMIALAAMPGSLAISKFGALNTLVGALLLAAVGAGLRGAIPDVAALLAFTTVMSLGIAVAQPALPVLVRQWLSARIGFGTAAYSNGMVVGCLLPMLLAPVLLKLAPGNWRLILAGSSAPIFVVAGLLATLVPRGGKPVGDAEIVTRLRSLDYGLVWRIGLIFLPLYLIGAGRADLIPAALAIYNFGQLPSSLLVMAFAHRIERRAWPYLFSGTLLLASIAVIGLTADAWTLIATATLGFASGISLVLGLALPPLLSKSPDVGRVSAGMFMVSYAFAMVVSVICGLAIDLTADARSALVLLAISVLPLLLLPPTLRFHRS